MRSFLGASRALLLAVPLAFPAAALAQTVGGPIDGNNTNANVQTGVNSAISTGQIGSNSRSRATGGNVTNNITTGAPAAAPAAAPAPSRTSTVRSAPVVVAPSIQGANPCTVGASAGSSWIPFGFALGGQWDGQACRDQEWFRILASTGNSEAGRAYVCARYGELRQAFAAAGTPCPQDRAAAPVPVSASVPPYCLRGRERGTPDRLMREWNCP